MSYTHLISVAQLQALRANGLPHLVFDCSFDLMQPDAADLMFRDKRLPGAVQAHLERDLSAHGEADVPCGGRHPLPRREALQDWLRRAGLDHGVQVVVYDRNGHQYCGRLWWLLKWAGHESVAILDGGLAAWEQAGAATESGEPASPLRPGHFTLAAPLQDFVVGEEMASLSRVPRQAIIDARAAPRYRGEIEPLDPVAGHIPGAVNRPFTDNFDGTGRFKPVTQLRAEFEALLGDRDTSGMVVYCGSGVSAVPDLVALELAGFRGTRLYAGSWSEWSRTPGRAVATGPEPDGKPLSP
jgi:thiosulfate/3-mercaptopyruvate sulfurtransferase